MAEEEFQVGPMLKAELEMVRVMTGQTPYRIGVKPEYYDALCAELGQPHIDVFDGVRIDRGIAPEVADGLEAEGIDIADLYDRATSGGDGEEEDGPDSDDEC